MRRGWPKRCFNKIVSPAPGGSMEHSRWWRSRSGWEPPERRPPMCKSAGRPGGTLELCPDPRCASFTPPFRRPSGTRCPVGATFPAFGGSQRLRRFHLAHRGRFLLIPVFRSNLFERMIPHASFPAAERSPYFSSAFQGAVLPPVPHSLIASQRDARTADHPPVHNPNVYR
ncbi:hypothetical protein EI77_00482 [Prosthecobacter fusiformis]|uniref:Uncharacterized protein n=1 Tax=Prosthecobacter fusiformis TaxID=48464 RepID=A0A4R7SRF1_9BACT|nr:hypothetical protein EI77_00482 [Prosthecobacter fusiformis]